MTNNQQEISNPGPSSHENGNGLSARLSVRAPLSSQPDRAALWGLLLICAIRFWFAGDYSKVNPYEEIATA